MNCCVWQKTVVYESLPMIKVIGYVDDKQERYFAIFDDRFSDTLGFTNSRDINTSWLS